MKSKHDKYWRVIHRLRIVLPGSMGGRVLMLKGHSVGFSSYVGMPWSEADRLRLDECLNKCLPVFVHSDPALCLVDQVLTEARSG